MTDFPIQVDSGTVYRRLRTMEQDDLVVSHWELPVTGPPRRTYSLTAQGMKHLERCADSVHRLVGLLDEFDRRSDQVSEGSLEVVSLDIGAVR